MIALLVTALAFAALAAGYRYALKSGQRIPINFPLREGTRYWSREGTPWVCCSVEGDVAWCKMFGTSDAVTFNATNGRLYRFRNEPNEYDLMKEQP